MARRKISQRGLITTGKSGLEIYLGTIAGKAIVNNIPQLQADPLIGAGVQIALAAFMSGGSGSMQANVAKGLAANAMGTMVNALIPGIAEKVGIAGPYGSYLTPGVAGRVGAKRSVPLIRVQ